MISKHMRKELQYLSGFCDGQKVLACLYCDIDVGGKNVSEEFRIGSDPSLQKPISSFRCTGQTHPLSLHSSLVRLSARPVHSCMKVKVNNTKIESEHEVKQHESAAVSNSSSFPLVHDNLPFNMHVEATPHCSNALSSKVVKDHVFPGFKPQP